jgi:hypothetical protein
MQSIFRSVAILGIALTLSAQDKPKIDKITITVGPSEPPLKPALCKESSYGNLHYGDRTKLTPSEIGEYVLRVTEEGNIVTVYPGSKDGIFVYARSPSSEPKGAQ